MNFYSMRQEFDRITRTADDATFSDYRDDFLNQSWQKISELFKIPSLKLTKCIDSVADQATYQLPYDYGGTDVYLWYKNSTSGNPKRLDPVTEEILGLMYERRSGNMGSVLYYDWTQPVGEDYAERADCVLTNNSVTVLSATAAALDVDKWIRFDPFTDVAGDTQNPGDYGYYISAVTAGVSFTLDRPYRGPASLAANPAIGRIRPAEQQQFVVYGNPSSTVTDAFTLNYYANPHRLYNDRDVPEWPSMGMAIVYMAISVGYDYLHFDEAARIWFGRAMSRVSALDKRRQTTQTLVHDMPMGSVSGRHTGPVSSAFWR